MLLLYIVNLYCSSSLFISLSKIGFLNNELIIGTVEDLNKSNLKISIQYSNYDNFFNTTDIQILSLKKNSEYHHLINDCLVRAATKKDVVCVFDKAVIKYFRVMETNNSFYSPFLRIAKLSFSDEWKSFTLEKASPYVQKFNKVYTNIIESGLYKSAYFKMNQKFRKTDRNDDYESERHLENETVNDNERILSIQCILILVLGILLSVISFISEIMIIKSKKN